MRQNLQRSEEAKGPAKKGRRGLMADGLSSPQKSGCREVFVYLEEIHERAVALSPLLKELLEFRPGLN
jgi:hypothetical protein